MQVGRKTGAGGEEAVAIGNGGVETRLWSPPATGCSYLPSPTS